MFSVGCVALPSGVMGLSAVGDSGISGHTHLLFLIIGIRIYISHPCR